MARKEDRPAGASLEEAAEKGYIGTVPDQTPNENYTVEGVIHDAPTPETTRTEVTRTETLTTMRPLTEDTKDAKN